MSEPEEGGLSEPGEGRLSRGRVRNLSIEELGLSAPAFAGGAGAGDGGDRPPPGSGLEGPDEPVPLPDGDDLLETVRGLLDRFGGVIFVGPSGTSKSHFAGRIAMSLAGSSARVRFVQFHASYQYEDFVQGYVPNEDGGGFSLQPKHLLQLARDAEAEPNVTYVLVIDELSRGDAARIFGEGLTYVEKTKRNLRFSLASGDECVIPPNLVFLATMNPMDRGVDEVDAAFERRFAKIAMDPSESILERFLEDSGMDEDLRGRVMTFFRFVNTQSQDNPLTALGHTYFLGVSDAKGLRSLWSHQLRFFFEKAYRLDSAGYREVRSQWSAILASNEAATGAQDTEEEPPAA